MFGDWDAIHQGNAISAPKYANADRGETIASLERNGANLAAAIRDLTDEQLDRIAVIPIFGDDVRTTALIIRNTGDRPPTRPSRRPPRDDKRQ